MKSDAEAILRVCSPRRRFALDGSWTGHLHVPPLPARVVGGDRLYMRVPVTGLSGLCALTYHPLPAGS